MAIDRANEGGVPSAGARAEFDSWKKRWVWRVTESGFDERGGCTVNVILDFFTGKQLDWYLICADNFN